MKSLLNKSAAREYMLAQSKNLRAGKFTRVSKSFMDAAEASLKNRICEMVKQHPSIGKTLKW